MGGLNGRMSVGLSNTSGQEVGWVEGLVAWVRVHGEEERAELGMCEQEWELGRQLLHPQTGGMLGSWEQPTMRASLTLMNCCRPCC